MEGLPVSIYLPVIREVCHTPVTLRAHNVEHRVWQRLSQSMKPGITKAYLTTMTKGIRAFETRVMNEVDCMVPISATDGQTFAGLGCSVPMHISPAGIVLEEYAYEGIFHGEPDLFYLGALDWRPNIEAVKWFIGKVWNEVRKEFPGIRFTVAGRNASVPFSRWLSSHDLYFEGEVESAVSFMRKHKIMVVPLFAGSGIRIKILEAMALGRIVICTSIAAEGIPCIPGRHLLVADTPAEFIEQIRRALTDKSLGEQIRREARTLVEENFDNFACTAALGEFYKAQGV
jgi:glycosyltransferase involved in cell wall biosynthesis